MTEELKKNIKQSSTWIRLLYLLLFLFVFTLVQTVVAMITFVQFIFVVATGQPNTNLQTLGLHLSNYVSQVIMYLSCNEDELPFPFGPWPSRFRYRSKSSKTQPLDD